MCVCVFVSNFNLRLIFAWEASPPSMVKNGFKHLCLNICAQKTIKYPESHANTPVAPHLNPQIKSALVCNHSKWHVRMFNVFCEFYMRINLLTNNTVRLAQACGIESRFSQRSANLNLDHQSHGVTASAAAFNFPSASESWLRTAGRSFTLKWQRHLLREK